MPLITSTCATSGDYGGAEERGYASNSSIGRRATSTGNNNNISKRRVIGHAAVASIVTTGRLPPLLAHHHSADVAIAAHTRRMGLELPVASSHVPAARSASEPRVGCCRAC